MLFRIRDFFLAFGCSLVGCALGFFVAIETASAADCLDITSETTFSVSSSDTFPDCQSSQLVAFDSTEYGELAAASELWGMPSPEEMRNVFIPIFSFVLILYLSAYCFGVVVEFASRD